MEQEAYNELIGALAAALSSIKGQVRDDTVEWLHSSATRRSHVQVSAVAAESASRSILSVLGAWSKAGLLQISWRGQVWDPDQDDESLVLAASGDAWRSRELRCSLHQRTLVAGEAITFGGYREAPKAYQRATRFIFPKAEAWAWHGCLPAPDTFPADYCPDCRQALIQWILNEKPTEWLPVHYWQRVLEFLQDPESAPSDPPSRPS